MPVDRTVLRTLWHRPGMTVERIADTLGITVQALRIVAQQMKLPRRGGPRLSVDVPELWRLWHSEITRVELAKRLGVAQSTLCELQSRYGLPKRRRVGSVPINDPTPEEIAERARECREAHFEKRRNEKPEAVVSMVSKRRARESV